MIFRSLFFSFLLAASASSVFGQNKLAIQHLEKNKQRIFKTGSTFQYITKSDSIYNKGKILDITDNDVTLLLTDNDPQDTVNIALSEFSIISKPSTLQYASYAAGSLFMLGGAYMVLEGPAITDNQWHSRGLGLVTFAFGLIPFLINTKTYKLGDRYQLVVIKPENQANY